MSTHDIIKRSTPFYFSTTRHSLRVSRIHGSDRTHPDETSIVPWKPGLVALQAAGTELLVVGGLAQWLCVQGHRWQRKSLLHVVA